MNARGQCLPIALLSLGALTACGERPPRLPPPLPAANVDGVTGDPAEGAQRLMDRGLGRTGFSCGDCHPVDGRLLRPAPALSSATAQKIHHCVERYLARPALSPQLMANLLRATESTSGRALEVPTTGRDLYDAACRHCHEDGPAGAILGRPFRVGSLRATIRGADRPPHPRTLMPSFPEAVLSEGDLRVLTEAVISPARGHHFGDQEEGI